MNDEYKEPDGNSAACRPVAIVDDEFGKEKDFERDSWREIESTRDAIIQTT